MIRGVEFRTDELIENPATNGGAPAGELTIHTTNHATHLLILI